MKVTLISVPFDQDQQDRGVALAPAAVLQAGLVERMEQAGIEIDFQLELTADFTDADKIQRFGVLANGLAGLVEKARRNGALPVILGGDCMVGIGAAAGLQRASGGKPFGIAWYDAHGDFNTPEISKSGFIPGMPLACICGHGLEEIRAAAGLEPVDPKHVIMLGVRDLDPLEKELLDATPISYLNPQEVAEGRTQTAAGYHFQDVENVYLHLDIDVIDPQDAPGVDFQSPGGISPADAVLAGRVIQDISPLAAIGITAFNPQKGQDGKTAALVVDLIVGSLGND